MIRPILRLGEAVLQQPSAPVPTITADIDTLLDDMVETMYAAPGVGLAAPQIGVALRVFVIDVSVGRDPKSLITLINPDWVERDGMQLEEEGCLSLPGFTATVPRPNHAVVRGVDRQGEPQTVEGVWAAGPRASARDGSPRRAPVPRPPPRHQARPHRPQDQEAGARRQVVDLGSCASRSSARRPSRFPPCGRCSDSAHEVVLVVTQPDRPRGRGQRVSAGPVKALAVERGIEVLQPERLTRDACEPPIAASAPDLGVVAAYGKILPEWLLALPPPGSHQRARFAAAQVSRRLSDSPRHHER